MSHSRLALRVSATVYAVSYVVALFLPRLPEGAYSDDQVSALFGDPAERTPIIIAGYALGIAAVSFLVFLAVSMRTWAAAGTALTGVVQVAGTAYAVMLMLAGVLFCSLPFGVALGELPAGLDPAIYRTLGNAAFYALLVPGLLAAAVMIVAASLLLRREQAAPRWVAVLGLVLAPLLLVGVAWVPQFLVPLWAVAVAHAAPGSVPQARIGSETQPMRAG